MGLFGFFVCSYLENIGFLSVWFVMDWGFKRLVCYVGEKSAPRRDWAFLMFKYLVNGVFYFQFIFALKCWRWKPNEKVAVKVWIVNSTMMVFIDLEFRR